MLKDAVLKVIARGKEVTPDLMPKGGATTNGMADAVVKALG